VVLAAAGLLLGFGVHRLVAGPPPAPALAASVRFTEISGPAGIRFHHQSGARGKKYMPETVGSGCAFLDYDGDGWQDLFYVSSSDWPGVPGKPAYPALYRNNRDGTFADVTTHAGLHHQRYGMGAAAADYDNDGDVDLLLTCIGPNVLYRNRGDGTFEDATKEAGVAGDPVEPGGLRWKWSTSASWLDYDQDGLLDLYVANYVRWTPATDVACHTKDGRKAYCPPHSYVGVPSLLYHNEGGGRFRNVSRESGIGLHEGKSFGVAAADFNGDGWTDLAVANDSSPNFLFLNEGGKRFADTGIEAGFALPGTGRAKAGMGIDAADWRNDGRFGLAVGNFSEECLSLFENDGAGAFDDRAYPLGMGESSLTSLTFGLFFFDFDLDGWQDVFAANGHIDTFVNETNAIITYQQRPLLYRNERGQGFRETGAASGLTEKMVLRGTAFADIDRDGDLDVAAAWNNGPARLWRNDGGSSRNWIRLQPRGKTANREGIGTVVRVTAGGFTRQAVVKSGGSFLSESERALTFGLDRAERAARVEVLWPGGGKEEWKGLAAGRHYVLPQGGLPERVF